MRIVQLTGSTTGGVGAHARHISALLGAAGHRVILAGPPDVATPPPSRGASARWRGVHVDIPPGPSPALLQATRQVRHLVQNADVVHAHGLRAGLVAALACAGRPQVRLVVTAHNQPVGGRRTIAIGRALETVTAKRADAVLGVSSDLTAHFVALGARQVDLAKVPARPTTPTLSREQARAALREEGVLADDGPVIITVARLAPQKQLHVLIEAAAHTAAPQATWLLAGDGPLRSELAAQIQRSRAPVQLLGRRTDVPNLLTAADLAASTATWEGQPVWIQEALGAGLPLVATDAGGTRDVVGLGPGSEMLTTSPAILLDPQAPDLAARVASRAAKVLADAGLAAQMSQAARDRSAQLPTDADVLAQLEHTYRQPKR